MDRSAGRYWGRIGWTTVLVTLGLAGATSAKAFEGTAEQREACTPDAFRLCSSEIPDASRVEACMRAKMASLSPRCRAVFEASNPQQTGPAPSESVAAAPVRHHKHERILASNEKHRHARQHERLAADEDETSYPEHPPRAYPRKHRHVAAMTSGPADHPADDPCEDQGLSPDQCGAPDDNDPAPGIIYGPPPGIIIGLHGPWPEFEGPPGPDAYPGSYIIVEPREDLGTPW